MVPIFDGPLDPSNVQTFQFVIKTAAHVKFEANFKENLTVYIHLKIALLKWNGKIRKL